MVEGGYFLLSVFERVWSVVIYQTKLRLNINLTTEVDLKSPKNRKEVKLNKNK